MITSMAVGNLTCGTLCAATTFKHSGQEKSFICSVTLIEWGKFTRKPILYKEFI